MPAWPSTEASRTEAQCLRGAGDGTRRLALARARRKEIRTKRLTFLDSASEEQEVAGRIRQIGNDFRHRRHSGGTALGRAHSLYVPEAFSIKDRRTTVVTVPSRVFACALGAAVSEVQGQ